MDQPPRPRLTKQNRFPEIKNENGEHVKKCFKCESLLLASPDNFYFDKKGMYGLNYMCKKCCSENGKKWREERREIKRKGDKKYQLENREKIAEYQKKYRDENKEKAHSYNLNYCKERGLKDPAFRINRAMRSQVGRMVKGIEGKNRHLPYSMDELRLHLEKQFTPGMAWENYGKNGWHIDHITPVSHFKFDSIGGEEFLACWSLYNLRPLWGKENLDKKAKRTHLI